MSRIIVASLLTLWSWAAQAAVKEETTAVVAELPPPDATGLIGFLAVMVGLIGAYVWWIMRKERQRKQREGAPK